MKSIFLALTSAVTCCVSAYAQPARFLGYDTNATFTLGVGGSWGLVSSSGPADRFGDITVDPTFVFDDGEQTVAPGIRFNHMRYVTNDTSLQATAAFRVPGTLDEFRDIMFDMAVESFVLDGFTNGLYSMLTDRLDTKLDVGHPGLNAADFGRETSIAYRCTFTGPTESISQEIIIRPEFFGDEQVLPIAEGRLFPESFSLESGTFSRGTTNIGCGATVDGISVTVFGFGVAIDNTIPFELFASTDPFADTNFDGIVDLEDLNNVRNNFEGFGLGDTDGNGDVTIDDLNNVRNNFGYVSPTFPAPVPEPAANALALLGAAALLARARFAGLRRAQ